MFQYLSARANNLFVLWRVPVAGPPGERAPVVSGQRLDSAIAVVMHNLGFGSADVESIVEQNDCEQIPEDPQPKHPRQLQNALELRRIVEAAYEGDPTAYAEFWLYEWDGVAFALVRPPTLIPRNRPSSS